MAEYNVRIRELPSEERPRERLRKYGASVLSTAELLAIILRVGVAGENAVSLATRLLRDFRGLAGILNASFAQLEGTRGLGEAKAAQLLAALELGRRLVATTPEDRPIVLSPMDVQHLLEPEMGLLEQEHLRVLLLNARNQLTRVHEVYKGTLSKVELRVAEVLQPAVRDGCASIILVHNHPSGDPTPSAPDIVLTAQLVRAAQALDIELLDHIILARGRVFSMQEAGMGFPPKPK
jgi:DNA repair protein RadC